MNSQNLVPWVRVMIRVRNDVGIVVRGSYVNLIWFSGNMSRFKAQHPAIYAI